MPIVIVTTHVNSKRTYDILHREGVDFILYKDHPNYSANLVLNHFISMRQAENVQSTQKNVRKAKLIESIEIEYYGAAEPPVRCGESHLSGLTEPLRSL